MNEPTYKIHGAKRRQLKKKLGELKRYVNNFWYYHQLEKDMASFCGGADSYLMSDKEAQKKVDEAKREIKEIESKLSVLFST